MTQLTLEIPDEMAAYLEWEVGTRHFDSVSDFIIQAVNAHADRLVVQRVMAAHLANDGKEVTPEFFESLRQRIRSQ